MPAPFSHAVAADIDDLDTLPMPWQPAPGSKAIPRAERKPRLSGKRGTKGKEGRELVWPEIGEDGWAYLINASGGPGVPSARRYYRGPIYENDQVTSTWGDFLCDVDKPTGDWSDHSYELREGIRIRLRNMTLIRLSP